MSALDSLIGETKVSNSKSPEVVSILTDLFMNCLLPPTRKLISITLRGTDWKTLKQNQNIDKKEKEKIYAYWHFENDLKDHYFAFLRNIQTAIQGSQEAVKCKAVVSCAKLLMYSPEKEQMLLSMLVNKLGDPVGHVAGKALYNLSELIYKHSNMCGVITNETEKLLFRPNISEKAQHFALSFLAEVAGKCSSDVCTKLVQICFSFFKIIVEKGEVNTKIMQAILKCIRRSISGATLDSADPDKPNILSTEMQDTIYRIVHLADITIGLQALCLLLQIITVKSGNHDR